MTDAEDESSLEVPTKEPDFHFHFTRKNVLESWESGLSSHGGVAFKQ